MKKFIVLLSICLIMCACSSSENVIGFYNLPKEIIEKDIIISSLKYVKANKNVSGGKFIEAIGIVPFNIKRKEVKPALLAVIRLIKRNNPKCEWISTILYPDTELGEFSHHIGLADYKEGKLTIRYGIPSDKDMEKCNSLIGKKSIFGFIYDSPRLHRPDKAMFEKGKKLTLSFHKFGDIHILLNDDELFALVAQKYNLPPKEVKKYVSFMFLYYTAASYGLETYMYRFDGK